MSKKYCTECGQPTGNGFPAPKFCSSCGALFSGIAKVSTPLAHPQPAVLHPIAQEDEPCQWQGEIPRSDEITVSGSKRKVTIGSMLPPALGEKYVRPKHKPMSKKAFLQQFQAEAGGVKRESITIDPKN